MIGTVHLHYRKLENRDETFRNILYTHYAVITTINILMHTLPNLSLCVRAHTHHNGIAFFIVSCYVLLLIMSFHHSYSHLI